MNFRYLLTLILTTLLLSCAVSSDQKKEASASVFIQEPSKIKLLIIDGMNNHNWKDTTARIIAILQPSGLFDITVSTSPSREATAEKWSKWHPDFSSYEVILNNFNGGHSNNGKRWPDAVEKAFERYVSEGGGVVNFHAANNAFLNWEAYNEMIGLGWRNPSFGRGVIVD